MAKKKADIKKLARDFWQGKPHGAVWGNCIRTRRACISTESGGA